MARLGHIAGLAGALSLPASLAVALEPPAIRFECAWDIKAQRFDEGSADTASVVPGNNGFAVTEVKDEVTGNYWMFLHHCRTDRYIAAVARGGAILDLQIRFGELLDSEETYTMDDFGIELAKIGAGVRRGQGDIGRCDCDTLAQEGYLE